MQELERIRRLRGLSQKDLADKALVAEGTVAGIEAARHAPRASTARKLASALGVEVADLYGEAIPKAQAPSPEILEGEEWERRRSRIMGLTIVATALRKRWAEELEQGSLAEHRAMEISFAIAGVLQNAESQTILGGLEHTDKADAKQVTRLREELERLTRLRKAVG